SSLPSPSTLDVAPSDHLAVIILTISPPRLLHFPPCIATFLTFSSPSTSSFKVSPPIYLS
ncbi:hypothetical protein CPB83DRAFT_864495, partial [Crepidotus variabilis]